MATAILIGAVIIVAFAALDAAAIAWGADSRDQMGDDYRR
jgi:hypothetical protein